MTTFLEKLRPRWAEGKFVCVGLDSKLSEVLKLVPHRKTGLSAVVDFNKRIIDATADLALTYKANIAFYSKKQRRALRESVDHLRAQAPDMPFILDFKRADIENTNLGYLVEAFEEFDADAVTVNPYLGREALEPFLAQKDRGIIVLCRTSNKGAEEFQEQKVLISAAELASLTSSIPYFDTDRWRITRGGRHAIPLYQLVALRVAHRWNTLGNCALVVGATAPEQLKEVREIVGDLPILVPGVGAQGGSLSATLDAGLTKDGSGLIINASRSIIFAKPDNGEDFAHAARRELDNMNLVVHERRHGR